MWHLLTYYLAENPWPLVVFFSLIGAGFLVAMRVTQDGRHLVRAMIALGLAGAVLVVDAVWVTEAERIEAVVRELADAVRRSDADAAAAVLDEPLSFGIRNLSISEELDFSTLSIVLRDVKFDWLHVSRLSANAGEQTHRGTAEFRVNTGGTYTNQGTGHNFIGLSEWSLGFRRTPEGAWKVTRITATKLPPYAMLPMQLRRPRRSDAPPSPVEPPSSGGRYQPGFGRIRPR
jgi:hypothetical protein